MGESETQRLRDFVGGDAVETMGEVWVRRKLQEIPEIKGMEGGTQRS